MNNNAYIELKSVQKLDGEKDVIELCIRGNVKETEDGYMVDYIERDDNDNETKTELFLSEGDASLTRIGATQYTMEFKEMESTKMKLNTPYGLVELSIITEAVKVDRRDNVIDVEIIYSLMQGQTLMSDTNLELVIKIDSV